jgi:hypothetical protein
MMMKVMIRILKVKERIVELKARKVVKKEVLKVANNKNASNNE